MPTRLHNTYCILDPQKSDLRGSTVCKAMVTSNIPFPLVISQTQTRMPRPDSCLLRPAVHRRLNSPRQHPECGSQGGARWPDLHRAHYPRHFCLSFMKARRSTLLMCEGQSRKANSRMSHRACHSCEGLLFVMLVVLDLLLCQASQQLRAQTARTSHDHVSSAMQTGLTFVQEGRLRAH
jgi:hypothetical protein